jgi:transcriptional regulator with XRE-family HTH domain
MARQPPPLVTIVKREMRRQKLTAYAIAEATGINRSTIYQWLRGTREIGEVKLGLILDALSLEVVPKIRKR